MENIRKNLERELTSYMKRKASQQECTGFVDGFEKACDIIEREQMSIKVKGNAPLVDVSNLSKFCSKIAQQKDCPDEFIDIVNKEFWKLI